MKSPANIELTKYIGQQIEKRRKEAGLTQEDLAVATELQRVSILNIEAGRHGATSLTLLQICGALGCTPNDLFPPVQSIVFEEEEIIVKRKRIFKGINIKQP